MPKPKPGSKPKQISDHVSPEDLHHAEKSQGTERSREEQLNAKELFLLNKKLTYDAFLEKILTSVSRSQTEFDRLSQAAYLALLNAVMGQTNAMVASQTGFTQNQSAGMTTIDRLVNVNEDSYVARGIIQDQTSGSVSADALRAIIAVEVAKALSAATPPQEE